MSVNTLESNSYLTQKLWCIVVFFYRVIFRGDMTFLCKSRRGTQKKVNYTRVLSSEYYTP